MKRILSVLLLLSVLVCALASCDTLTAAAAMTKAEKALEDIPYTVTVSMDFACEDEKLNAVFDALSLELPVTVDGDNLHLDISTEVMGFKAGITMTVVDKVLYANTTVMNQSVKLKATLTEENYEEFIKDNNTELPVTTENFETLSMEVKDGKQIVTCSGITTEGLTELNKVLADAITDMGAEAAVGDLSYVLTIADGKYESMALTASYTEEYFRTHRLLCVVIESGSGSNRYEFAPQGLYRDSVTVREHIPEVGTCDMAAWLLIAEVDTMFDDGDTPEVNFTR